MDKFSEKISKLKFKNGNYEGGFSTLSHKELLKIKGGSNAGCTNSGNCSLSDNSGFCTNSGTCYVATNPG